MALACTLVASFIVLAPLDRAAVAIDAAAAALSIGNIRFALAEGDYFAAIAIAVTAPPLLVAGGRGAVLPRVAGARPRGEPGAPCRASAPGSPLSSSSWRRWSRTSWSRGTAVSWAFYSLPTRAWQLSLGGLIAVAAVPLARIPRPADDRRSAGWRSRRSSPPRWCSTAASPTRARGPSCRHSPPGRSSCRGREPTGRGASWPCGRCGSSAGSATRSTSGTGRRWFCR